MTLPDWTPTQCMNCGIVLSCDERDFWECPHRWCTHDPSISNHHGTKVCPLCGEKSFFIPGEDWDGGLITDAETEIAPPPIEHADRLEESLVYAGTKWTKENVFG